MSDDRKNFGRQSEEAAARFLKRQGYEIIERNARNTLGEIDIVAKHKNVIVFVEVKARRSQSFGHPKYAVTPAKQRKLSMVALAYLKKLGTTRMPARFDVVTVQPTQEGPHIEVITNAFELAYP
ncbi:MAG: YraN family protein [Desulfobacteraceae bacterium]|nr:YraN family protein [Desulfobacteraceae bacterium]